MASPGPGVDELDSLVASAQTRPLSAKECQRLVILAAELPGRVRTIAQTLGAQRSSEAVTALLQLPSAIPGVVEGVFQALSHGVARRGAGGRPIPIMSALDFRRSRAQGFSDLLDRARAAFGPRVEHLEVEGRLGYRIQLAGPPRPLAQLAASTRHDLQWLHRRLGRLRGTRLWLNGWCFPQDGPVKVAAQVHLLRAWHRWVASPEMQAGNRS